MDLPEELRSVLTDRTRGASEIEERLLRELLGRFEAAGEAEEDAEELLTALTVGIRGHQPAMANLLQLANRAWLLWQETDGKAEESDVRERLTRLWRERLDRLRERERDLGGHLVAWAEERWGSPPGGDRERERPTVLTLSRSGTVRSGLVALREAGWNPIVMVGEGRPGNEGRDFARELRTWKLRTRELAAREPRDVEDHLGVDARLVTDAVVVALAAGSSPGTVGSPDPERTVVLVGADAVGPESFLNKVGTRALAAAARERALPVLVPADAAKLVPEELFEMLELPEAPAEELEPPAGVPALSFYFETVPLELVSGVVSEDGVAGPEEVRRAAAGPVSPRMGSTGS